MATIPTPVDEVLARLFPTQIRGLKTAISVRAGRPLNDADATKVLRYVVKQVLDANAPGRSLADFRQENADYTLGAINAMVSLLKPPVVNVIVPPPAAPTKHADAAKPDKGKEPLSGLDTWIGGKE